MQKHENIPSLTKITRQGCDLLFCVYKNSGSDPKGNLIPAIVGGAAMTGAVVNAGFYVAKNVRRLGTKDFNLGNVYTLFIRSCFEITWTIRIDPLSKLQAAEYRYSFIQTAFVCKCLYLQFLVEIMRYVVKTKNKCSVEL